MRSMKTPRPLISAQALQELYDILIADEARARLSRTRYEAALKLGPPEFRPGAKRLIARARLVAPRTKPAKSSVSASGRRGKTWISEVMRVVDEHKEGISSQNILAVLLKTPLGKSSSKGHKGFYHAVTRLTKRGEIVKYGTLFVSKETAAELEKRGEKIYGVVSQRRGSSAIVIDTLDKHPEGLTAPQLQEIVAELPDAPKSMKLYRHYIYNILSTLKNADRVEVTNGIYKVKVAKGLFH